MVYDFYVGRSENMIPLRPGTVGFSLINSLIECFLRTIGDYHRIVSVLGFVFDLQSDMVMPSIRPF